MIMLFFIVDVLVVMTRRDSVHYFSYEPCFYQERQGAIDTCLGSSSAFLSQLVRKIISLKMALYAEGFLDYLFALGRPF